MPKIITRICIKNIVDMSGNKQLVITRACMSYITRTATALRQHIASALLRVISLFNFLISTVCN